jgi:hypothetical protein
VHTRHLQLIDLDGCSAITNAAIEALQQANATLKIHRQRGQGPEAHKRRCTGSRSYHGLQYNGVRRAASVPWPGARTRCSVSAT